ncbi:MAG: hypothetical protein RTV72_01070 [Candidatus Thorarchaeota archaeon]
MKNYYDFLSTLSQLPGVDRIRPILAVDRSGGKNYIDMNEKLEFEKDDFSNSSKDIDLSEYIP